MLIDDTLFFVDSTYSTGLEQSRRGSDVVVSEAYVASVCLCKLQQCRTWYVYMHSTNTFTLTKRIYLVV